MTINAQRGPSAAPLGRRLPLDIERHAMLQWSTDGQQRPEKSRTLPEKPDIASSHETPDYQRLDNDFEFLQLLTGTRS
jgi:hypothetical protein